MAAVPKIHAPVFPSILAAVRAGPSRNTAHVLQSPVSDPNACVQGCAKAPTADEPVALTMINMMDADVAHPASESDGMFYTI